MYKIVVICFIAGYVNGGFFDLTDVEDPLALLWNLSPLQQKFSECIVDGASKNGVCMDKAKCILTGGTPSGRCGIIFFICCSYEKSCVKTSDKRQSYFDSSNISQAVTNCKYTIKLRNKNVCQVRLDFQNLTLAQPSLTSASTDANSNIPIYKCVNDELRITPNTYGVPVLCGNNTNQHVYIHVNQTADTNNAVNLDINLANRITYPYLPTPTWKIKFTQLECPTKKNKFDISKFKEVDQLANDFNMLAPEGVIQYFTESKGVVKSFGFNETTTTIKDDINSYPYLQHYTIAFKRPSDVCGIKFIPVRLNLLANYSHDCYHYLFIPELYQESSSSVGSSVGVCIGTNPFYSFTPGPLYINFKALSTEVQADLYETQGFILNYELQNTCPATS